ncbi:unnamed protein product, partial [Scytosiphon promiscuus]
GGVDDDGGCVGGVSAGRAVGCGRYWGGPFGRGEGPGGGGPVSSRVGRMGHGRLGAQPRLPRGRSPSLPSDRLAS